MRAVLAIAAILVAAVPAARGAPGPLPSSPPAPAGAPQCAGDYADELTALVPRVRDFERDPANQYSYCLRTTATYECLSYAPDGSVRRSRKNVVAHGTGFAYRRAGADTYLLTNDHVASWPAVTDEEHRVDDVPDGCKLVSESVRVVENEDDDYESNDVGLQRVASDPALDVAVMKARHPLKVIPYRLGRSSALHVGNLVAVRGFPLGAFAATNLGKVVNAYDHDVDKDWDHVDFVVDALLSPGNSGSPVFAVSCRTGEYELVGIYHAGYVRGSALNVVIGIDQVRDLMTTLKRAPRVADAASGPVGPVDREAVRSVLTSTEGTPLFPFGPLVAAARVLPSSALAYEVYTRSFPLDDTRLLVVEDLPSDKEFGDVGRVYLGNARGLRAWDRATLDADAQAQLSRIVGRLRAAAVATARFRAADVSTSKGHKRRRAIERELRRQTAVDRDVAQALLDLADRLGPRPGDHTVTLSEALQPPAAAGPAKPVAEGRPPPTGP
jgi:S1-C subfamily serine protease